MTTAIIAAVFFVIGLSVGNKFAAYGAVNLVRAYFYRQGMHAGAVEDPTNLILNKDAFEDLLRSRPLSQWGKWHAEHLRLPKEREARDG